VNELSRRTLLTAGLATGLTSNLAAAAHAVKPLQPRHDVAPDVLARDEKYWHTVAAQYDITHEAVMLENGYWGVLARPVQAAYERNLRMVNERSSLYARREFEPDLEKIRHRVAAKLGVEAEEIVFTRGATDALQALIGGYNRLRPGDAVLYSDLDYDSMQAAMNWLPARRGVDVVRITLPEPATYQGLIDTYAAALAANPRVRLILLTHVSHRTGLILPVKEIVTLARSRGVDAIVDCAHSWGQFEFRLDDLGADFVGLNLHKWIGAPLGVGVLYIRRARIPAIDPYMANEEYPSDDVRARIHAGTANFANFLTVTDALDFQESIGSAAKEARLRHLRDLWVVSLRARGGLEILTPQDPRLYCAITSFRLPGKTSVEDNKAVAQALLDRFGVFTTHRAGIAAGACVRVTPALFTSDADIQRLEQALQEISRPA
jgi:selenocysteine lyase/cysteine desulfurase